MHTAARLFDSIMQTSMQVLESSELRFDTHSLQRQRRLIRIAALLHDVGHSPFSHGSEDLFPDSPENGEKYKHEDYSAAIVREKFRAVIDDHPTGQAYGIRANDVAALIEGSADGRQGLFWRDLISGQMDADRMDYLLRDSYHTGVQYGLFDLHRVIGTIRALPGGDGHQARLGFSEGGWHAAEALVLARYFMFTQVYFHKTRVAYDIHLRETLRELLPEHRFPKPEGPDLDRYLEWDDWRVLGLLAEGKGGEHGMRLSTRQHYRRVYHTPEIPRAEDLVELSAVIDALGDRIAANVPAEKNWYKLGPMDIPVLRRDGRQAPLSAFSRAVAALKSNRQTFIYVRPEHVVGARKQISNITGEPK
jgi:HD superfamily phosphohydrolase